MEKNDLDETQVSYRAKISLLIALIRFEINCLVAEI